MTTALAVAWLAVTMIMFIVAADYRVTLNK